MEWEKILKKKNLLKIMKIILNMKILFNMKKENLFFSYIKILKQVH